MRTIPMTLDDNLVKVVERISKRLNTNRSAFTKMALREALSHYDLEQLEHKHRQGYEKYPVNDDEFSFWEKEQAWGDE